MLCSTCVSLLSAVDRRLNSEIGGGWDAITYNTSLTPQVKLLISVCMGKTFI